MTSKKIALLDVNLLIALFFADHVHHDIAHDWFEDHRHHGWATCPITENGFVRVACRVASDDGPIRPGTAIQLLSRLCKDKSHHAWTDDVSLMDASLFSPQFIRGHSQITDVYLLGLATRKGGALATFDRTIPLESVPAASAASLQIISADNAPLGARA